MFFSIGVIDIKSTRDQIFKQQAIIWSNVDPDLQWSMASKGHIGSRQYCCSRPSGPWFNIKMSCYQYRKSHRGDKTVVRSSYLQNGISYTGKMISLYWIRALVPSVVSKKPRQIIKEIQTDSIEFSSFYFIILANIFIPKYHFKWD